VADRNGCAIVARRCRYKGGRGWDEARYGSRGKERGGKNVRQCEGGTDLKTRKERGRSVGHTSSKKGAHLEQEGDGRVEIARAASETY